MDGESRDLSPDPVFAVLWPEAHETLRSLEGLLPGWGESQRVNNQLVCLQLVNKAPQVQRYVQLAMSLFRGSSRSVIRATARRTAPICVVRRAASSATDSQQKV